MRSAGDAFEQRACAELQRAGLTLLTRNHHTRHGELDLVMLDRDTVVFVEVRYRQHASHGDAVASITQAKQKKLVLAAQHWLAAHTQHARKACRFDVVGFDGVEPAIRTSWLRAAFETN